MKYCPYCGTEITDSTVSFCAECGEKLENLQDTQPKKERKGRFFKKRADRGVKTEEKVPVKEHLDEQAEVQENDYDGYYDDIVPQDSNMIQQTVDKDLIKRLVMVGAGFITVIGICIAVICLM
jgi:ribosome-binding protein aMBF1 (putative translation factor)